MLRCDEFYTFAALFKGWKARRIEGLKKGAAASYLTPSILLTFHPSILLT
jgi:hypothetical protein